MGVVNLTIVAMLVLDAFVVCPFVLVLEPRLCVRLRFFKIDRVCKCL